MRVLKILIIFTFCISLFANYTLVLKNGQKFVLKEKPDLNSKVVKVKLTNGKNYVFRKDLIDLKLTEKANAKNITKKEVVSQSIENKKIKNKTKPEEKKVKEKTNKNKKVIVVNEKNFIRTVEKPDPKRKVEKKNYDSEISESEESGEEAGPKKYEPTDNEGNTEGYWKNLFKQNKVKINASEYKIKQMEISMTQMATAKLGSTDTMYIMQISNEMDKLQVKIDKEKKHLEALKKEKRELLQKAKRAGAWPGWYRDYE